MYFLRVKTPMKSSWTSHLMRSWPSLLKRSLTVNWAIWTRLSLSRWPWAALRQPLLAWCRVQGSRPLRRTLTWRLSLLRAFGRLQRSMTPSLIRGETCLFTFGEPLKCCVTFWKNLLFRSKMLTCLCCCITCILHVPYLKKCFLCLLNWLYIKMQLS